MFKHRILIQQNVPGKCSNVKFWFNKMFQGNVKKSYFNNVRKCTVVFVKMPNIPDMDFVSLSTTAFSIWQKESGFLPSVDVRDGFQQLQHKALDVLPKVLLYNIIFMKVTITTKIIIILPTCSNGTMSSSRTDWKSPPDWYQNQLNLCYLYVCFNHCFIRAVFEGI